MQYAWRILYFSEFRGVGFRIVKVKIINFVGIFIVSVTDDHHNLFAIKNIQVWMADF